ncbi:MAG: DUF2934 domain-containing protein [Calditrichaeota bacterium]|nr:DUF2934 domain-containing protein [Calditrichota bacterium]
MSTATVKKTTKMAATRATAQGSATRKTTAKKTTTKKATNKAKTAEMTATGNIPNVHDIRQRAFELYVTRGCQPGRELKDWLQAEQELHKN